MNPRGIKKIAFSRYGLVIFWALLIFSISSIPHLSNPVPRFKIVDKVIHYIEFGIFGYLLMSALVPTERSLWRKRTALACIIGVLYGFFDETYQSMVPGRAADPYDVAADVLGVLTAVVLWIVLHRRKSIASPR